MFTQRTEAPTSDNAYYFADNPFYQSGYGMPNCTCYAYGRFWEITKGTRPNLSLGDAGDWWDYSDGYDRGQYPQLGAVCVWKDTTGGAGHVAIVEEVYSDGRVLISQSAWGGTFWWTQVLPSTYYFGSSYSFCGFIYNPGVSSKIPDPISGNRYLDRQEMKNNAIYIYYYLKQRGWSLNAIAGMLGNMQTESTINPGIWQNLDSDNTSGGFGLVQWTPATKYFNWCDARDLEYDEMDSNLQRILYEVENNIQWIATDDYNFSFRDFTTSGISPYKLAEAFLLNYERPADQNQPLRGLQAMYWYKFLKDYDSEAEDKKKKDGYNFVLFNNERRKKWISRNL